MKVGTFSGEKGIESDPQLTLGSRDVEYCFVGVAALIQSDDRNQRVSEPVQRIMNFLTADGKC